MLIKDEKPIFGTIITVSRIASLNKTVVTMETADGETMTFDATIKLKEGVFKLISDDVYYTVTNKSNDEKIDESELDLENEIRLKGVKKGVIVETLIMSGRYQGIWVKAKVLLVESRTMDLRVLHPRKWKVAGTALAVPKEFIRKIEESEKDNYTVPVRFAVDDSVMYVSCSPFMKVCDLKQTVVLEKKYHLSQIYFIHKKKWLTDYDSIPNDVLFCIIHRAGPLTSDLIDLVDVLNKKRLCSVGICRTKK